MSLVREILEKLESDEEDIRLSTIEDIIGNNILEAVPYLIRRLSKEDSLIVKESIILALKTLDCSGTYNQLFYLFKSPDAYLRNSAIGIFASSGEKAIEFLRARFEGEDREVKKLILDTLFEIGTHNAILAIRPALKDEAINVKITAIEYLGRLKDYDSVPELLDILRKSNEPMVIVSVIESLLSIDDRRALKDALDILITKNGKDTLFIPEILKLSGRLNETIILLKTLESLEDLGNYAEEILFAIEELDDNTLVEFLSYSKVQKMIVDIIRDDSIDEDIRYKFGEYLPKIPSISPEFLLDFGVSLLTKNDVLKILGITLIGKSRCIEAKKILLEIIETTEDEVIKNICQESLTLLE